MSETEELLNKILIVHYPHHGEMLTKLHHFYNDVFIHIFKENSIAFPEYAEQE